jgi:hypothetical protein
MSEVAQLCDYCPLRKSCGLLRLLELANLREIAAETYYDDISKEISDLPQFLMDGHDASEYEAHLAIECLNKIYRNNCPASVIGHLEDGSLGVVARK